MKIEVKNFPKLSLPKKQLVNMHSIQNVVHILCIKVDYLSDKYSIHRELKPSLDICVSLMKAISSVDSIKTTIFPFLPYKKIIKNNVEEVFEKHSQIRQDNLYTTFPKLIDTLFQILEIRIKESKILLDNPEQWCSCNGSRISDCLEDFLNAVAQNSLGEYGITFNGEREANTDYNVRFNIKVNPTGKIQIPLIFNDVIRDTVANARKYSSKGSKIDVFLGDEETYIDYWVKDEGIGIPERELNRVVDFGYRASNTYQNRTYPGGKGLTKAAIITNQLHGKMWIDSEVNHGTTVQIQFPKTNLTSMPLPPCY